MNPIMGKLGNHVAQFLTPTPTKAVASDATITGAAIPTAFATLLANVGVAPKVVAPSSDQPKPVASSGTVGDKDLLIVDLPLGNLTRSLAPDTAPAKVSPRPEAIAVPKGVAKPGAALVLPTATPIQHITTVPKSMSRAPDELEAAQAMVEPLIADAGTDKVQSASNPPGSLPIKHVTEQRSSPISAATPSRVNPRSKTDVEPEMAKTAASDENSADIGVGSPPESPPAGPMPVLIASPIVVDAKPTPANLATPQALFRTGESNSARTAPGVGQNQEPAAPVAANGNPNPDAATPRAPKELPPEFAAVLAASTEPRSKSAGNKPDETAFKAVAPQSDVPVFLKPAVVKDATLQPPVVIDHSRAKTAEVTADSEVTADDASTAPVTPSAQPVTTPIPTQPQPMAGGPVAALSTTLGQQVIDMSSGGQWIDGLAHEIAALSKGEGHGSFRLSPEHLGPMRVEIRPSDQGANVTLTVETKAAESMLIQDRNVLKADAQLASVKIGEVTVERVAQVHEPARADTATGQGTGQGSGQGQSQTSSQAASQGNGGQGSNQAALAQGQGQSQHNGNHAGNRKVSSDTAVSSQAEPREPGDRDISDAARRARYA